MMIFILCLGLWWESCSSHPSPVLPVKKVPDTYAGLWINQSWLDSLTRYRTARFVWSHGLTDLYVFPKLDSALLADGDWAPRIAAVKASGNKVWICDSRKDSCYALEGNSLELSAVVPSPWTFHFTRPDSQWIEKPTTLGYQTASRKAANQILIAGSYRIIQGPENLIHKEIQFDIHGKVSGLEQYRFYDICYSGDCKRYCDEMDLVYLSPMENQPGGMWYGWQWRGNRLEIFSMRSLEWMSDWPDIQPVYKWITLEKK